MRIGTTIRSPQGTIEASVLIGGTAQALYRRPFDGAVFVAGVSGEAYTLLVRNLTAARIEVVSSVDQRNTLEDEAADSARNRGLIFAAHHVGAFTGWRINDSETRQFLFGAPERSVVAQATGSPAGVGVIGFAVYQEQWAWSGVAYAGAGLEGGMKSMGMNSSVSAGHNVTLDCAVPGLGTGIGERQDDRVGRTSFTRAAGDPDVLVIRYDTLAALEAMGITGPGEPDPFPGVGTGYEKYASR